MQHGRNSLLGNQSKVKRRKLGNFYFRSIGYDASVLSDIFRHVKIAIFLSNIKEIATQVILYSMFWQYSILLCVKTLELKSVHRWPVLSQKV